MIHVVHQGEFLDGIASKYGLSPDAIWNHPDNARLAAARHDRNMLCFGDVLTIPEPPKKVWFRVEVGAVNRFAVRLRRTRVTLKLVGKGGALANALCRISGVRGLTAATTDAQGLLVLDVPVTTEAITVDVDQPRFHVVARLGHLDPPDTLSGVRMRLRNLHYLHDRYAPADLVALAVAAFQRAHALADTGVVDDATRGALVREHGC